MSSQDTFLKAMEIWANVYMARSLPEYIDFLKTTGVSMQQASALTFIYYNNPSKISDICKHMMVSAAAASQMVDRLEKQNLVQRILDPDDRRVRNVMLSDQGQSFVQQSISARQGWLKEIPGELSEEQLDHVSTALQLLASIYK